MLVLVSALVLIVAAAVVVVGYVAYPHRDRAVPGLPGAGRLSARLRRAVDAAGLDPDTDEAARGGSLQDLRAGRPDAGRTGPGGTGAGPTGPRP